MAENKKVKLKATVSTRVERQAKALRENLRRRKNQARQRQDVPNKPGTDRHRERG